MITVFIILILSWTDDEGDEDDGDEDDDDEDGEGNSAAVIYWHKMK